MRLSYLKNKILIILIIILLILSLNFYQREVKNFFYLISLPLQNALWRAGDRVSNFLEMISEIKNLKKENEELKLKIQELISENTAIIELKKENEIFRAALDIGLEKEFKLTISNVIGKDISQDSLIINKGSRDGLLKGLPVITQQKVLCGKISEVFEDFSRVMLTSHKESSFDSKIQQNDIPGVIKGKGNLKLFLDFVPRDKEIREGDIIVTSSLGGIFPEGLLVGQVTKIKKLDVEPFQQAEIKPAFDIAQLEKLFIILEY